MASKSSASELTQLIHRLGQERQHHLNSITEIDRTFQEFGLKLPSARKGRRPKVRLAQAPKKHRSKLRTTIKPKVTTARGRRRKAAAAKPKKFRTREPYAMSGSEVLLSFVKQQGSATTQDILRHWQATGRRGKPANYLTALVNNGALKRSKLTGQLGSSYSLGAAAPSV